MMAMVRAVALFVVELEASTDGTLVLLQMDMSRDFKVAAPPYEYHSGICRGGEDREIIYGRCKCKDIQYSQEECWAKMVDYGGVAASWKDTTGQCNLISAYSQTQPGNCPSTCEASPGTNYAPERVTENIIGDDTKTWQIKWHCMVPPANSPASVLPSGVLETRPEARTKVKYNQISKEISDLLGGMDQTCNVNSCPVGEFAGCVLRFAGHDFMDFKNGVGGSDGCVDFTDPDNAGLKPCLVTGENGVSLASVWVNHRNDVSLADFLVIAAEAVMVRQRGAITPALVFNFKFGRRTTLNCMNQPHLPQPTEGCSAFTQVFNQNLQLTNRQAAAIMGVHTLGRARPENSGFDGWWSDPVNSQRFNNNYYLSLLLKGWAPETTSAGKKQWGRVGLGSGQKEMMLNTDICIAFGSAAEFAESQNCCAWMMPTAFTNPADATRAVQDLSAQESGPEKWCGFTTPSSSISTVPFGPVKHWCCNMGSIHGPANDCGDPANLIGAMATDVKDFAVSEAAWIAAFQEAWKKVTELNPFGGLTDAV